MFKLWIGNRYYTRGHLVNEVKELLYSEGLSGYNDVELLDFYGLSCGSCVKLPRWYGYIRQRFYRAMGRRALGVKK